MPIQPFSFPVPETRFFLVDQYIYKFKIRRGSKISGEEEMFDCLSVSEELENAVRVVLVNLDNLHPFSTQHFNIFPYRSRWEHVSELRFRKEEKMLFAYPFLITLYVETAEPVSPLSVSHSIKQIPELSASFLLPPVCEPKRRKTEGPPEGSLNKDYRCKTVDTCWPPYNQRLPYLTEGAEDMVCGNKFCPDSNEFSQFTPVARNLDFDDKQDDPEISASSFTEKETQGLLTRLASAVFPFSLFFRKS